MLGMVLLAVLLTGVAGWLLGWSSVLTVKQIEVVGVLSDSPIKSQSIIALSGIRINEPMARLSGASVKRELAQIPRIKSVSLLRHWPHRVVLVIKERIPTAAIVKGNEFQLIDSESKQYATVSVLPSAVPTVLITGDYKTGLRSAMSVITELPVIIRSQLTHVESSGSDGVQLTLRKGARIIWGSSEDFRLKSRVLATLLTGAGASKVKTFDVSAPFAPTTK
jgi:cell division protein FtsQ